MQAQELICLFTSPHPVSEGGVNGISGHTPSTGQVFNSPFCNKVSFSGFMSACSLWLLWVVGTGIIMATLHHGSTT